MEPRVMIDVEDFCRTTLQMPGLRDVYYGNKMTSWIYIPSALVKGRVDSFHSAYMRLHAISKIAGVLTILHAPEERYGKYKLVVTKGKHLDDCLCIEYGCPVVDSTCERCPSRGIE